MSAPDPTEDNPEVTPQEADAIADALLNPKESKYVMTGPSDHHSLTRRLGSSTRSKLQRAGFHKA